MKICGLTDADAVGHAAAAGANYVGFVFFPPSPRSVTIEKAAALSRVTPRGVLRVALTVDADDMTLARIVRDVGVDMLQFHGAETPERVTQIRKRHGLPVMKAMPIGGPEDVAALAPYAAVANQLLLDARPAPEAALPGGNGEPFDWALIRDLALPVPWMLAGGLTPDTVAEAVRQTGARQVDVSSGVEAAPGVKDLALVRRFIEAARAA